MSISTPFIRRPVGTTLLALALFLIGSVAYFLLPVASLPAVDFPIISITAARPGADPETMAASVAAPLERRLANISSLNELTSISSLGVTQITAQFDIERSVDAAARDVQAAINAAMTDLPTDLSILPTFRKANSSGAPALVLALTSDTMPTSAIFDATDTVIAQRISQVSGVGNVMVAGATQPAVRVELDPARLATMGLGLDQVANVIANANVQSPTGAFNGDGQGVTIATDDQLNTPRDYRGVVVASKNGAVVRLGDVAKVERGVLNRLAAGWYNGKPAVILVIFKQPGSNVIETVDAIKALLPTLKEWVPQGIDIAVLSDRTQTIRSGIADIQRTLFITVCLVMAVVLLFLRRLSPVLAAGITVPLSLVGSCAAMWAAGFSIDNLSLMALTISVGFVVDDAIVMIENVEAHVERGMGRMAATLLGAKQIAFTVVSISLSLIAVFIPLLFMPGVMGRLVREFAYTLTFSILISMVISLTVTPMLCAWLPAQKHKKPNAFDIWFENGLDRVIALYERGLRRLVDHPWLSLGAILVTVVLTVVLYSTIPKGNLPQDDIGLLNGTTEASADVSFAEMERLQKMAMNVLANDPDVANVGSFIGSNNQAYASNQGRLYVALKPSDERRSSSFQVIDRLRPEFAKIPGLGVFLVPSQDLRTTGRQSKALYQYTVSDSDVRELDEWMPKISRTSATTAATRGCFDGFAAGRAEGQCRHRPQRGVAHGRPDRHAGRGVEQRLRAAAGFDHLHAAQQLPRRRRSPADPSARHPRFVRRLCDRRERNAGSAHRAGAYRTREHAAGRQPSGRRAGDHDHLQSRDGNVARAGHGGDRGRGRADEPAARAAHRLRRRRRGFPQDRGRHGADHPGRAGRGLHHPRHSLRELHSSDHDHLDLALGGRRRLAGA